MRITLTGRRLALAAVLVLGGVAAPLAYATIAADEAHPTGSKSTRVGSASTGSPLSAASGLATKAPTSTGDNPYQFVFSGSVSAAFSCGLMSLPAGQDFALSSLAFIKRGGLADIQALSVGPELKTSSLAVPQGIFALQLEFGLGAMRFFDLVVRPDTFANAAVGDIYDLNYCIQNASPGTTIDFTFIVTGQKLATPTPVQVASFDATSGKAGATLRWKTASETEILGFNIWRYRGAKGVKVNRTLIRAKRSGKAAGASYRYVDYVRGAKRGLSYRLQLVDLEGKRTWYAAFAIASK